MNRIHKNKTQCCMLSAIAGALGLHRFYLYGRRDTLGWAYLTMSMMYLIVFAAFQGKASLLANVVFLFPVPVFAAVIEALSIGLTDDEKWDRRHNLQSPYQSRSKWPLAVVLVLTLFIGYTGMVASLARATDLLYTGGSFG